MGYGLDKQIERFLNELGPYWTRTKPLGPLQSQLDSALVPKWGNTAVTYLEQLGYRFVKDGWVWKAVK